MLTGFSLNPKSQNDIMRSMLGAARWSPYVMNWPVVLAALRKLWEEGKVSQLKSPFYELIEKPTNK
jgi:hypothetical protein